MYYLEVNGRKYSFNNVKSAKREGDISIECGAYDAKILSGCNVYAYRAYNTPWKRVYGWKKTSHPD